MNNLIVKFPLARNCLLIFFSLILSAVIVSCTHDGGGDRAEGVLPGPNPPDTTVPPPAPLPPNSKFEAAEQIIPVITAVAIPADGQPRVDFQVTDGNGVALLNITTSNVRFIIAKLQSSAQGNNTGAWQSYINRIETPSVGIGTEPRLQATTENNGELTNNGDGTYSYQFASNITALNADIIAQAATENLDLSYEANRTHRVAIQFSGAAHPANPIYDFVPETGATSDLFHYNVVATANCNRCHDDLALHGGGRIETQFCVTCHNPGSTDANSTNSVDFKQMIHKIHRGAELPSVQDGGEYVIYGFRNSMHDYSAIRFPQDIRNCQNCHAGPITGDNRLVVTSEGDNWTQFASQAACGSCHDDVDFSQHQGGQSNDDDCMGCHSSDGDAGSIRASHLDLIAAQRKKFAAEVLQIDNTAPGEFPTINFRIYNPEDDSNYNILTDPAWTSGRLAVTLGWSTDDYHNTGNGSNAASTVSINALTNSVDNGDGSFRVVSSFAIPDGSVAPFVAATGSGVSIIEGRAAVDVDEDGSTNQIPLSNAHGFFSIDETNAQASPRRQVVELSKCQNCHESLVLHGGNRSDNIDSCVTCHNPRNTDRAVRAIAANPPTDGKDEEALDFKTMIHGIHAAAFRESPLEIVGFNGFNTYRFDTTSVHFPGVLGNCTSCHTSSGYQLPLAPSVLGTTIDTGADLTDPSDDIVVTPISAVCSSCHDGNIAKAHMESNGGNFATTQADIDANRVLEQCSVCHGSGATADVSKVHPL